MVVRPTTKEQLGQCVKKLYDNGIPMTVRGAGTNLSGGTIPDKSETVVNLPPVSTALLKSIPTTFTLWLNPA